MLNKIKINRYYIVMIVISILSITSVIIGYFGTKYKFLEYDKFLKKSNTINNILEPGYIPNNFTHIEGYINTGYVIQDNIGNQFVWVPVDDNIIKMARVDFFTSGVLNFTDFIDEENIVFLNSVKKYKGFYIGRYESGKLDNKLVIKKNVDVYNKISPEDALSLSKSMYEFNSFEVHSDLINSYAWDTTCIWLSDVKNVELKNRSYIKDSTNMGNYTSMLMKTGNNEAYKTKNIYDLAGNVAEITSEQYKVNIYDQNGNIAVKGDLEKNNMVETERGGYYNGMVTGLNAPTSMRIYQLYKFLPEVVGFRVILYK